jgi:hypothetical protein
MPAGFKLAALPVIFIGTAFVRNRAGEIQA